MRSGAYQQHHKLWPRSQFVVVPVPMARRQVVCNKPPVSSWQPRHGHRFAGDAPISSWTEVGWSRLLIEAIRLLACSVEVVLSVSNADSASHAAASPHGIPGHAVGSQSAEPGQRLLWGTPEVQTVRPPLPGGKIAGVDVLADGRIVLYIMVPTAPAERQAWAFDPATSSATRPRASHPRRRLAGDRPAASGYGRQGRRVLADRANRSASSNRAGTGAHLRVTVRSKTCSARAFGS